MKLVTRVAVPAVLCGIGVMGVVADSWLVRAATCGSGATSDPGYYDRALAWDDQQEAKEVAARLGISMGAELETTGDREARLCITLHDATGAPVEATKTTAAASANLCARGRIEAALERAGDRYCTTLANPCEGVWIVDVRAEVTGRVVAATARTELRATP